MQRQSGVTIWLTGLPCSGKSTVSQVVASELKRRGCRVEILDGDVIRTQLSQGLGFSREDRDTHIQRISFVAQLLTRNGVIVLVAAVSPYFRGRQDARKLVGSFIEVHVACPLSECERRDVKGMYAKAREGQISAFTGVSDPYETPVLPELVLDTLTRTPRESGQEVLEYLERHGYMESL